MSRARSDISVPRPAEHVAHAANRVDQPRAPPVHLLAEVADVRLEHAGVAAEVVLPDVVEDLGPAQDTARIEHQVAEQAVLGVGELDLPSGPVHLAGLGVQLDVLEREAARVAVDARPAQDRPYARDQLLDAEGLGDVVVAAEGEPADLVLGRVASGEEQDRQVPPAGGQPPGHLEAVEVGQHYVEDQHVRPELLRPVERLPAGAGGRDVEARVAQRHRHELRDVQLVVDHEHARRVLAWRFRRHLAMIAEKPWSFLRIATPRIGENRGAECRRYSARSSTRTSRADDRVAIGGRAAGLLALPAAYPARSSRMASAAT